MKWTRYGRCTPSLPSYRAARKGRTRSRKGMQGCWNRRFTRFQGKNECNLQAHLIRKLLRCSVSPSSRRASTAPGRYLQGISTGRCPLSSCLLQGDPGPRSYSSKVPWPACPAVSFSFRNLPGLQGYGYPRPCQITTRS